MINPLDGQSYIYFETSNPVRTGQTAVLRSSQFNADSPEQCMTFAYHMYGKDMGSLELDLVTSAGRTNLFKKSSGSEDKWKLYHVNLAQSSVAFRVRHFKFYKINFLYFLVIQHSNAFYPCCILLMVLVMIQSSRHFSTNITLEIH